MPFYEYQCQACGAQTEVLQKVSDAPLKKCPECGKSRLTKLMSAPVFRLKGGGWYETDFKSDGDNKRNLVEADKAPEQKAEAKADAKPDAASGDKAEAKSADKAATGKPAEKSGDTASKSARKTGSGGTAKATASAKPPARKSAPPARKSAASRKRTGR
jgi:putative FmdB family regulatory protein